MTGFLELNQNELLYIEGGDLLKSIGYASATYSAVALSSTCFGAITAAAPAIVTTGLITGGLGFGCVALVCAGGAIITLFE